MGRVNALKILGALLLAIVLTACPHALISKPTVPAPAAAIGESLTGQADFGGDRRTQADMVEVGTAATVSLIDSTNGYTIATTVTNDRGAFVMKFESTFRPTTGRVMYLEAVKGLTAGTTLPNRVGADLARVRTLIRWQDGGWTSISSSVPGAGILVNPTTTAFCIIASLRSMTASRQIDLATLIGIMQPQSGTDTEPSPYSYANTGLMPTEMVRDGYRLVRLALSQDADPFRNISLDTSDALLNTLVAAPKVLSVAALIPDVQLTGGTIEVLGSGFSATPSENVVEFSTVSGGAVQATVNSVSADLARLNVTVPLGADSGPVAVTVGGRKIVGPSFFLALQSGHEAIDGAGNLYVANESFGTIAVISPQGQVRTFTTGLDNPRALTLRNGVLYVTCAGSKRGVVAFALSTPLTRSDHGTAGSISDPRGIAFDSSGGFFVSDGATNRIYRIDSSNSAPTALSLTGATLSQPRGIAFGSDGRLYVANYGDNRVLAVDVGTGAVTVFKEGFTFPWGVAFDSLGNLYVTNNQGNSVYRWQRSSDTLAPYADMPSPGAVVADRAGYIYAIDNTSNNIYRITSQGDSAIYASGISSPTGMVKVGSDLYVLSSVNNSLVRIDTTTTELTTLARGFNNPFGLAYDDTRDCFYVSSPGNGTIVRVDRTTGAATTVLSGTGSGWGGAWGISYRAGRLLMRSGRSVRSYDVTNFAAAPLSYESVMLGNRGIARDTSVSANAGSYYIASGGNRVLRVVGDTGSTGLGSSSGANRVVVFKDPSGDANLSSPRDVTVDTSGRVWVLNEGNARITTYNPNGTTAFAPITDGLSSPLGINRDADTVWVANNGNNTVTGYSMSTGARSFTLSIADRPRNLCIAGNDMYLVCNEGVGRITNYRTSPAYTRIYGLGGYNDIEVRANGDIYVLNGSGRRIESDLSADVAWYSNYHSPQFFWKDAGDELWLTDNIRFTRATMGNYVYRLLGVTNWFSGPTHAGVDSNGNIYLNGQAVCTHEVVNRILPTALQEEWSYNQANPITCWVPTTGAFSADALGNFYISRHNGLNVTRVTATGASAGVGTGRSTDFTTYGAWVEPDGSVIFQSIQSHHRIEQMNLSTGARTILPYGISASEM